MSAGGIFGVTVLVVVLVGGVVVGAMVWRSRRAASRTNLGWDMATLMGPQGNDYQRLNDQVGGNNL